MPHNGASTKHLIAAIGVRCCVSSVHSLSSVLPLMLCETSCHVQLCHNETIRKTQGHIYRNKNNLTHRLHDDVIKWKHFPRNWPFVREIHRSPVNFPHNGQWRGALMFSLIYAWINDWVNNHEAGDLRRQHGHYDVIVMIREVYWD